MAVITATFILGLLGVLWLYVLRRAGYDVPLEAYEVLHRKGWGCLAGPLLIFSMAFTPEESERDQKAWIYEWRHVHDKEERTIQEGLWLLEEEDTLTSNVEIFHDPNLQTRLVQVQEELSHIIPNLIDLGREKCQLQDIKPDGAWTRYRSARPDMNLDSEKQRCALRYGCCSRGCGCCEKVREGMFNGKICMLESHCTDYCGCCIRYRESLKREREREPVGILPRDQDGEEEARGRRHETFNPQVPSSYFDSCAANRPTSPEYRGSPARERRASPVNFSDSEKSETGLLHLEQRLVEEE
ncbi:hypothetical protein ASPCADRAFT_405639 [Aspergillus carbonarius ITEM 5010]|uniref:Uncharacterized protein n=1 Tax=Aspergillus carbonarius (strain ITEM 5010) TaxID=602072 RepID=A0A1R3RN83_ASPC5|nr:hypothetical protein ASPCADRAFT_405639 [Aspergillus carbonarius ITEM 5010]